MSKKFSNYIKGLLGIVLLIVAFTMPHQINAAFALTPIERLGKSLFFDKSLSLNGNQSCASCHEPSLGYTGPGSASNAHGSNYQVSDSSRFGNRRPASVAYAGDSPRLQYDSNAQIWIGGLFWDGRATGEVSGDPLAEQAQESFLSPVEMSLASTGELCKKVAAGTYVKLYEQVWGAGSLDCSNTEAVYDQIGKSVAAYERSMEVSPYSSKFDQFWDKAKSKHLDASGINTANWSKYQHLGLTDTELYGLAVFNDPAGANCAACHSLKPGSKGYPLFTNYSYVNLGVPRNLANPFYSNVDYNPTGQAWLDNGLGDTLENAHAENAAQEKGKVKVPTLRNVDKRPSAEVIKAYGHNGYFKSLDEIVHFHAARGMAMSEMWCAGMNYISCNDQTYIVSFLKTLSDGYFQR
jgi:cytochrome c peroxidase